MRSSVNGLIVVAAGLLAACQPQPQVATAPPSPAYAKVQDIALAAPARGACLSDADAATLRGRIVQQEFALAARQCNMIDRYNAFAGKYSGDLSVNGNEFNQLLRRRGLNANTFVTDIANKAATRSATHGGFCNDARLAYDWALSPATTSLAQIPPLYDNVADHGTRPCTPPQIRR